MSTPDVRTLLKGALLRIEALESTIEKREAADKEPIAIIGMACRFPAGGSRPEAFWQALVSGTDGVRRIPESRWPAEASVSSKPAVRWAGLLDEIDGFDAAFFGISPREAIPLDPQQRLLLEVAWELWEDAGQTADRLLGTRTGVFVGMCSADYGQYVRANGPFDMYSGTGCAPSTAAGRLSYVFGFQGPSMTIDTACSSSLVALHLACQSLRHGESDLALAGGVNLVLDPTGMAMLAETQALAPDGRCKAFDARANGFVRGEGCGLVALKRLSSALRDGDTILALIRGTAINQDGRSTGLTAPNVLSQQAMLRAALSNARLAPEDIGYVETHGTGTSLGDPIEFEALREVLGKPRSDGSRCVLGAVKTNVGHLEGAAGIAGLIKAILCLRNEAIPRNIHFETLNPRISIEGTPFVIPTDTLPWKSNGKPRRAGVSSFGISGTNAHVILEEAPRREERTPAAKAAASHLVPLSAKSQEALAALARSYAEWLPRSEASLPDIAYAAGARRTHLEHRLVVVARSKEELARALGNHASGETAVGLVAGRAQSTPPKVVFVFPGQGSQWVGMGKQLLEEEPAFREAIAACDEAIQREAGFSVIAELVADESSSRLGEIDVVQPVLFAIEVALSALWRSWGVEPSAVVGHSMGEVAAAHVAGALSLADAAAVICRRSRLLRRVRGQGAMALVELSMPAAESALAGYEDRLSVAVSNGPRTTVIAGDPAALAEVMDQLAAKGVFCRRVKVDVASHSPQVDPLRRDLTSALAGLSPRRASVAMCSTVTGERLVGDELSADYWADNLRKPVLFSRAVAAWIREGHTVFVEMSPHPILLPSVEENLRELEANGAALASLRRGQDERMSLLEALGTLHVHGYPVAWKRLHPEPGRVIPLPTYPWQRERYWVEGVAWRAASRPEERAAEAHPSGHPLLGVSIVPSSVHRDEHTWQLALHADGIGYLADHRVQGQVVFPAAGYVEMGLSAGATMYGAPALVLEEISFEQMLALPAQGKRIAQVVMREQGAGRASFQIASRTEDAAAWTRHASGTVRMERSDVAPAPPGRAPSALVEQLATARLAAEHYARMAEQELEYGPSFQGVLALWPGEGEVFGRVRLPEGVDDTGYVLHPALLDACLQVSAWLSSSSGRTDTFVPVGIARFCVYMRPGREAWVRASAAREQPADKGEQAVDLQILDDEGRILADVEGLRARRLPTSRPTAAGALDDGCVYETIWRPATPPVEPELPTGARWLVFADRSGVGDALAGHLSRCGQHVVRVVPSTSYARLSPDLYCIDPCAPGDYQRLLRDAFGEGEEGRCQGVVHLFSVDAQPLDGTTSETLAADLALGTIGATYLVQAISRHGFQDAPALCFVTRGARAVVDGDVASVAQAPLGGLLRSIVFEHPELRCTGVDLDPAASEADAERVLRELSVNEPGEQIALRGEERYVARIVRGQFDQDALEGARRRVEPARGRPFRLEIRKPGVLERMALYEMEMPQPGPFEVLIEVEAAGLNFLDVLVALGALPDDATGADGHGPRIGGECAGRIISVGEGVTDLHPGQAVVALGTRAFGSHVLAPSAACAPVPPGLGWEEAATVPLVFMTVYQALQNVGRLCRGERVLIHAAAGGVGLAAVQWAKFVGAEIFATAGSEEKRSYLRSLGVEHVFDSRSLRFAEEVKRITKGEGVDVVLNSLSGEFIPASLKLLRDHGRFVELGKTDYYEDKQIGLRPFLRNLSFSLLDLRGLMMQRPERMGELLREVMRMFASGVLKPLPVRVFPASRAAEAFQHMAQARHIGKIAISLKDPAARIVPANEGRAIRVRADRSYLIAGGLGGLGLALARWLHEQGARALVLLGRREPSLEAARVIEDMESAGTRVLTAPVDVSRHDEVSRLLSTLDARMPPLGGIVHAAAVLDDRMLLEQSEESFRAVFAPKALGAWNLHVLSEGRELDFFVMYSSAASLFGSPGGQANYAAANAFLDALAHLRAQAGLPAMSIQWGAFADVGLAAAQDKRGKRISYRGVASMTPAEGHEALRRLFEHPRAEVGVLRFDLRQWLQFYPIAAELPLLAELPREGDPTRGDGRGASGMLESLERAASGERLQLLQRFLSEQIGAVLRLDASRVERTAPFPSLGLDSLMNLEVRNRLETSLMIRLSATSLFSYPNIAALSAYLLERLFGPNDGSAHGAAGANGSPEAAPALLDAGNASRRPAAMEGGSAAKAMASIPRLDPPAKPAPLSPGQERLWLIDSLSPGTALYNVHIVLRIEGPLDSALLRRSLAAVVERHGSLRTTFSLVDDQIAASVAPPGVVDLEVVDLRRLLAEARQQEITRLSADNRTLPFDLARGPLWRARLLVLDDLTHLLLWTQHHITTDGWSIGIFLEELCHVHRAFATGQTPRLKALPIDYADYAAFQRATMATQRHQASLAWWKERLTGLPRLNLPVGRTVSAPTHAGDAVSFTLPAELADAAKTLAMREGRTLFVTLLAVWVTLLHRYSGQADFPIGTITAGRNHAEVRPLLGFFANTLVLRCDFSSSSTFVDLMRRLQEVVVEALEHEEVPFDEIVRATGSARQGDLNPLFQACLVLENLPAPDLAANDLRWTPILERVDAGVEGAAKFDIGLTLAETSEGLRGTLEYATDLYARSIMERMVAHFETLLRTATGNPEKPLAELRLITDDELRAFDAWNDTDAEFPANACIHELFEAQARVTPDATAVEFQGTRLTYAELDAQANRLAHHLRTLGVGPEVLVGLCVERSLDMMVGLLGTLKAGGAYVPLDPMYPAQRLSHMLSDASVSVLLTQSGLVANLPEHAARTVRLDADGSQWATQPATPPTRIARPDNLAYVIYTSGSTGRPKGVALEHRGGVAFLAWTRRAFTDEELVAVLASTSISFDVSFFELFAPLIRGGRIRILRDVMEVQRADLGEVGWMLVTVPSAVRALAQEGALPRGIRTLNLAGEALDQRTVDMIFARAPWVEHIRDLYGPTEDTTYSTCAARVAGGHATIGRPIENTSAYVLDAGLMPTPIGVPGELYLSSRQLARGYLHQPGLSAERFVPDPFSSIPGARMYRTGDLARWGEHGELEYLGRIDHQVKIRGYRIELKEIEAVLAAHPLVRACVVVAREEESGDKRIVAYLVPGDRESTVDELRQHVRVTLPEYMIPSAFVWLESLPLTPNGKIDRKALPVPERALARPADTYVAPRNTIEETLSAIWADVLALDRPGIHDNFFDLGGSSILAFRVVAQVRRRADLEVPIVDLFRFPTIAALAERLSESAEPEAEVVDDAKQRAKDRRAATERLAQRKRHKQA